MAKRSALGNNLRSAYYIGRPAAVSAPSQAPKRPGRRVRLSVYIAPDLLERTRAAVEFLSEAPQRETFTALFDRALTAELDRLSKLHNHGKPFPPQSAPLRHARAVSR